MPNDAKLGLVIGMGLVIALAVVFYRKDGTSGSAAAIDKPGALSPVVPTSDSSQSIAKATGLRKHTVQPGETLADISRQYFGDATKASAIRTMNRSAMEGLEAPEPGSVLYLPSE